MSGATPSGFPTLVPGVPGAGSHQIPMYDGVFAECDDNATITAFSPTMPSGITAPGRLSDTPSVILW